MKFTITDPTTGGNLLLICNEQNIDRLFYLRDRKTRYLTIAWNRGEKQNITIDEVSYDFPAQSILPLMVNQSFTFEHAADIVAWQFNREFYCIVDHDQEVSCVGFLFYGMTDQLFISIDHNFERKLRLLLEVFIEEFGTKDNIQAGMLLMLLKRLIILVTRLAKLTYQPTALPDDKFHIIRKFNLAVENNYHKQHTVSFYAHELNKSPKTLANLFALYNHKSPLMVIRDRIILEAKRLLHYTDKSAKEIGYELGFDDAAYFSNFFKKHAAMSPTDFRAARTSILINGK